MPELPEVETVRAGLSPHMEGAQFTRVTLGRPDLRFPFADNFAGRLQGATLTRLSRRAKFLMAELSSGETLIMHLGMSGRFTIDEGGAKLTPGEFTHPQATNPKHDHVIFDMSSGARIVFNDPRRFGFMELFAKGQAIERLAHLGPEPLSNAWDGEALAAALAGRRTPIKTALLDQRRVAGIGNIYVCEALHRAHVSPLRKADSLSAQDCQRLTATIRDVLTEAIEAGGSSLRDFHGAGGELGYFQHRFGVYDREGDTCSEPTCNAVIERIVQGGRSTFFCPTCQT